VSVHSQIAEHENVVPILGVSQQSEMTKANGNKKLVSYIALPFAAGGEFMDLLMNNGGFSEEIARNLFK
jgi:serine/threonine protein kinase